MSGPRTKRQFAGAAADPSQRQITSFLAPCTPDEARSAAAASAVGTSRQTELPASVQSNLLSVGMRVRKSVPEGYKTNAPSAFKLWTDNTNFAITPVRKSSSYVRISQRELLPFCGINKIGGLDTQPESRHDVDSDNEDGIPTLDALPELTMSQESVESTDSSVRSRKRAFQENDVDEPAQTRAYDGEVSPRTLVPSDLGNARVMAVPQSRVKEPISIRDLGHENVSVQDDFEEAGFLVYSDGREMDTS